MNILEKPFEFIELFVLIFFVCRTFYLERKVRRLESGGNRLRDVRVDHAQRL